MRGTSPSPGVTANGGARPWPCPCTARGRWRGRASGCGRRSFCLGKHQRPRLTCVRREEAPSQTPALASPSPQPGPLRPLPAPGPGRLVRTAHGTPRRALPARSSRLPHEGTSSLTGWPESVLPRAGPQGWAWRWCSGCGGNRCVLQARPQNPQDPLVLAIESQRECHLLPDPLKWTPAHSVTSRFWFSPETPDVLRLKRAGGHVSVPSFLPGTYKAPRHDRSWTAVVRVVEREQGLSEQTPQPTS